MRMPRIRSFVIAFIGGVVAIPLLWLLVPRGPADAERFLRHRGELLGAAGLDSVGEDGRRIRSLELTASTGLRVRGRVSFPARGSGPWPVLVLQGGLRTGSSALFHVPDAGDLVLASLDYSYRLPRRAGFLRILRELPDMRERGEQGVAGLLLLQDYLESLPEVDPGRTILAGGSLGVFFASVTGALDTRYEGVALLYGGADPARIAEAQLPLRSPVARWATRLLLKPWLDPVDPVHFVPRIARRPVLLVNGGRDTEIPPECVIKLHEAAREPKTVVWVDTPHRVQGRTELSAPVAEAVWAWMEAYGWLPPAPRS